jgi:hypothetical protein
MLAPRRLPGRLPMLSSFYAAPTLRVGCRSLSTAPSFDAGRGQFELRAQIAAFAA